MPGPELIPAKEALSAPVLSIGAELLVLGGIVGITALTLRGMWNVCNGRSPFERGTR